MIDISVTSQWTKISASGGPLLWYHGGGFTAESVIVLFGGIAGNTVYLNNFVWNFGNLVQLRFLMCRFHLSSEQLGQIGCHCCLDYAGISCDMDICSKLFVQAVGDH